MITAKRGNEGFTIVELLIVIVVIAILAAITIVSYNGIQTRAAEAVLLNDLSGAAQQLEQERVTGSQYPGSGNGLKKSAGTTFVYNGGNASFCLTGTSNRAGVKKYHVSNEQLSPKEGECPVVPDTWAVTQQNNTVELGCTTSCTGNSQLLVNNFSYNTGAYAQLDGGTDSLLQVQYACNLATCGNVTFTISADPPLMLADEFSENWTSSFTRGTGALAWGQNGSRSYRVKIPENAPAGTTRVYLSSASAPSGNLRIYSSQQLLFTK